MSDGIFKFDKDKHDKLVQLGVEHKIKLSCGTIWTKWKNRVLKLPKSKRTRQHIVKMLMDLRKELDAVADEQVGPWKSYTLNLIDDVIERSNITLGVGSNTFWPYIPGFLDEKPMPFSFRSLPDFLSLPYIVTIKDKGGKILRDGLNICAFYSDGEVVHVGKVKHNEGIALIPTVQAYREELEQSRKEKPE